MLSMAFPVNPADTGVRGLGGGARSSSSARSEAGARASGTSPIDDAIVAVARRNLSRGEEEGDEKDGDGARNLEGSRLSTSWTHGRTKADAGNTTTRGANNLLGITSPNSVTFQTRSFGAVERTLSLDLWLNTPKTGEDLADDDNNDDKNNATPAAARRPPSLVLYSGMPTVQGEEGVRDAAQAAKAPSLGESCAPTVNLKEALRLARATPPKPTATTASTTSTAPGAEGVSEAAVLKELEAELEALRLRRGGAPTTASSSSSGGGGAEDLSVLRSLLMSEGIDIGETTNVSPKPTSARSSRRHGRRNQRHETNAQKESVQWKAKS